MYGEKLCIASQKIAHLLLRRKNQINNKLCPMLFTTLLKSISARTYKNREIPKLSPQFRRLRYADIIIPLFFLFGNSFFAFILRKLRQIYASQNGKPKKYIMREYTHGKMANINKNTFGGEINDYP
jgi:hypothetical protein